MKTNVVSPGLPRDFAIATISALMALALPSLRAAAAPAARGPSDIVAPSKREAGVTAAKDLTRPPAPAPLPAELLNPFNPVDFDKPDPEDVKAAAAAAGANPRPGGAPGSSAQPAMSGDRDILETLAARPQLQPNGVFIIGGRPQLLIGRNRFPVGTRFTVEFNGQDYELELTAIDRTTFTLRYRGEEVTRPIKPVK